MNQFTLQEQRVIDLVRARPGQLSRAELVKILVAYGDVDRSDAEAVVSDLTANCWIYRAGGMGYTSETADGERNHISGATARA